MVFYVQKYNIQVCRLRELAPWYTGLPKHPNLPFNRVKQFSTLYAIRYFSCTMLLGMFFMFLGKHIFYKSAYNCRLMQSCQFLRIIRIIPYVLYSLIDKQGVVIKKMKICGQQILLQYCMRVAITAQINGLGVWLGVKKRGVGRCFPLQYSYIYSLARATD